MAAHPIKDSSFSPTLGRYRLLAQLGQGGMGSIHLALMKGSGEFEKLVVLKELRPDLTKNSDFVSMFLHEAKLAGRLNHTNIVQTLEAGHVGDRYFLSMEYLEGQPFSDLLFRSEESIPVPLSLRLQVVCDVLAGLHYAHELKDFDQKPLLIVHCDVSPSNVFITYDGSVKVIDFGVARAASAKAGKPGSFQGTLRYAAPEQLLGQPVDRRADVFSAGVLLWEAVALSRFSKGTMDQDGINRRINGMETRLSQAMPHVDSTLAEICDRALSVDPNARFPTAEQFRLALIDYALSHAHRMDPTEISRIMRTRFASARAAKHLLIQKQLKQQNNEGALPLLQESSSADDDVTTVADLSTFVRATRRSEPPPEAEPLLQNARARRRLPLIVAGAGLGLLSLVWLVSALSGSSEGQDGESAAVTKDVELPSQDETPESERVPLPPPDTSAPDATVSGRGSARTGSPSLDQETSAASEAKETTSSRAFADALRGATPRSSPRPAADAQAPAPESAPPPPPPPAEAPSVAPAPTRPAARGSAFDKELGAPAPRERRAIDADNPFR